MSQTKKELVAWIVGMFSLSHNSVSVSLRGVCVTLYPAFKDAKVILPMEWCIRNLWMNQVFQYRMSFIYGEKCGYVEQVISASYIMR